MNAIYLSDFLTLMGLNLDEIQSEQNLSIASLEKLITALEQIGIKPDFTIPQSQVIEVSVSLPVYISVKTEISNSQTSQRLVIGHPSSLLKNQLQNLGHIRVTFKPIVFN